MFDFVRLCPPDCLCVSVWLYVWLGLFDLVCLTAWLSIRLTAWLSIRLTSVCLTIFLTLSDCKPDYLSVWLRLSVLALFDLVWLTVLFLTLHAWLFGSIWLCLSDFLIDCLIVSLPDFWLYAWLGLYDCIFDCVFLSVRLCQSDCVADSCLSVLSVHACISVHGRYSTLVDPSLPVEANILSS